MNLIDFGYMIGLAAAAPVWMVLPKARRKVLKALRERRGDVPVRSGNRPAVMIHAVSLGEMNATRALVSQLREAMPQLQFIVSSTSETGFKRANALYGNQPDVTVILYPVDFTGSVDKMLDRVRPTLVVLLELEVWPNFLRACAQRGISVLLVNGRLTSYSYRMYRLIAPITRAMMGSLASACVQDEMYAARFESLGAKPSAIRVTGTMKFDTAEVSDRIAGDAELARQVGIAAGERVWVAGSTGPGEEEIVLRAYGQLRKDFPSLRLAIVPRKPERFDEVAALIESRGFTLTRRSRNDPKEGAVILGDTMGELRKFYSLASAVFVGRSLVDLGPRQHGSDMIEPAALAKACVTGPFTGNFADVMNKFRAADAMREAKSEGELEEAVRSFLSEPNGEPNGASEIGRRAQQVVVEQKGATERHAQIILDLLKRV